MKYQVYQGLQVPNIEDKDAVLDILSGIMTIIDEKDPIRLKKATIGINNFTTADNAIYYNRKYMYIPESVLRDVLTNICYMDIPDQVSLLKSSRYEFHRIIPEAYYTEIQVENPIGSEIVDCLTLDYKVIRMIRQDFDI